MTQFIRFAQKGARGKSFPRQAYREKAEHRDAGRGERKGKEGDAGVNPRARQAEAFVRIAPRVERRRFPLRKLRSLPHQGRSGADGRAQRRARDGARNRDGRRSGSAQGAGRGSGRKPRTETPAVPARAPPRSARLPSSAEPVRSESPRRARNRIAKHLRRRNYDCQPFSNRCANVRPAETRIAVSVGPIGESPANWYARNPASQAPRFQGTRVRLSA